MSENDIIAEYVKNMHPEILKTTDFALYKFSFACRQFVDDFVKAFQKIDFKDVVELSKKSNKEHESNE